MTQKIIDKLKDIVANELDVNLKRTGIDENASLFEEGLGLDSVTLMEFISLIETNFSVQFLDAELDFEQFKNLTTLAGVINNKLLDQEQVF
jgi:acyl carrier protein